MGKKKRRKRKLTRHHNINKSCGGRGTPKNIIYLKNAKHQCWHQIFHNLTFLEASRLLLRVHNLKNNTNFRIVGG